MHNSLGMESRVGDAAKLGDYRAVAGLHSVDKQG